METALQLNETAGELAQEAGPAADIEKEAQEKPREAAEAAYRYVRKPAYEAVKRAGDIVLSSAALIALLPVLIIVALIIVIDDPQGGPIYTQTRIGKNGKPFKFYKFRSMVVNADALQETVMHLNEMDGPVFKITDDPRITHFGKFIRKTSIDELPQLINIIRGEMSIVGPRPPLPQEVAQYTEYQMHRLDVKGGLSCYWQVSGRSELGFNEWVRLDLKYIMERSIWTDMKIIWRTFGVVFRMTGAK